MDAEDLGRKLLLTLWKHPKNPSQPHCRNCCVATPHKNAHPACAFEPLSSSSAKPSHLGSGKAFEWPPPVCLPKQARPFTRLRWDECWKCIYSTFSALSFCCELLLLLFLFLIFLISSALPNIPTAFPPKTLKMGTPKSEIGMGREIPGNSGFL